MVPGDADQLTATFEVFDTKAVNCIVPEDGRVAIVGVTVTAMVPGVETVIWNACAAWMPVESKA
jgi:hypothetical protein